MVRDAQIDVIMFHHTAGFSIGSALYTFLAKGKKSGAHFLIDLDGHVIRLADDRYATRHGGGYRDVRTPSWAGTSSPSINKRAIGIEHLHDDKKLEKGDLLDSPPYTDAQYEASVDLIKGLRAAHGVTAANVIGHQDVTAKSMCPGRRVDWPRLEAAGASLAPAALNAQEQADMFGGFYAGPGGATRRLVLNYKEKEVDGMFEVYDRKGKLMTSGLSAGPITSLRESVRQVGYCVEEWIVIDGTTHRLTARKRSVFEETLGYALSQFIRHYCTGSRIREDLYYCYREIPRVWNKLFVDFELAKLIHGAAKAAIAARGGLL